MLRFLTGSFVSSVQGTLSAAQGGARFPAATLCVNVIGCFVIGILGSIGQHAHPWSANARLFLFTGLLGGFTTYSAFGYETFELARVGAFTLAGINVVMQLLLGLAAVWAGYRVALAFAPALMR